MTKAISYLFFIAKIGFQNKVWKLILTNLSIRTKCKLASKSSWQLRKALEIRSPSFWNNFHLSTCECDKRTWPWFLRSSLALTTFHPLSSLSRQYLMASSAFSKWTGCCSSGSFVDSSSGEPLPLIRVDKAKLSRRNRSKLKSSGLSLHSANARGK